MNKKTWLLIALVSAIWICLFPFIVLAEGVPYYSDNPLLVAYGTGGYADKYLHVLGTNDYRVIFSSASNFSYVVITPDANVKFMISSSSTAPDPSNSGWKTMRKSNVSNGVTYYWQNVSDSQSHMNMQIQYATNQVISTNFALVMSLTYGYVEPEPPINWGALRNVRYSTSIAGNNEACMQNVDTITWDFPYDTNNNDISECQVEVRAVRGRYNGTDKMDLLTKKYTDFVLDNTSASTIGIYQPQAQKVSVSWASVCQRLNIANFLILSAHLDNEYWIKEGWIYQARLINSEDEYVGEWQTIYTGTSSSAKGSETIINNINYDVNVYQALQEITVVNNNTSVDFIYENTNITIQNPNDGTEPEGGTNLWDVLKQLITGLFQILAKLGDLVGNLIDGLMGIFQNLFTPPEVDQEINNNINVEVNTYLEESQPGLNQIHNNIDTWKLQLEDIASDYENGGDCIIEWEDVSIDLSAFNAGTVTFIPGGTYNLKTAFINLLTSFGVSYSTYEMIVSAIIYISLIVLISHKVKGFLKT